MKQSIFQVFVLVLFLAQVSAQNPNHLAPNGGGEFQFINPDNCLDSTDYVRISQALKQNIELLKKAGKLPEANPEQAVSFSWPLQQTAGLGFNNYYGISNFVDHDNGSGLLDYDCNNRTYNGHKGIDYFTWPFPWYIYNNNYVEVVAAANGTIIFKEASQDDDHCSCFGSWNAVYVQHADGSIAWYGHLKKNSLTTKSVGQQVAAGEYLGVVASSGCSTGPHLHLEVYDSGNNLIDPYQGPCNGLNSNSWWIAQPPYREPTVNAILTHSAAPVLNCPGTNEAPNFSDNFSPTQTVYMGAYYKDQLNGDMSTYRIRRPNNTVWNTWTHNSPGTYNASWWWWSWVLPSNGPFGIWKFEVTYYGQTFTHEFNYFDPLPIELLHCEAKTLDNGAVALQWSTATERNNSGFDVEHSRDALNWNTLDFVAGQGNSQTTREYSYLHKTAAPGMNYYRLKQLDLDGSSEYTKVVSIARDRKTELVLFPNPTSGIVEIIGLGPEPAEVSVWDCFGRMVYSGLVVDGVVDLSGVEAGVYFLSLHLEESQVYFRVQTR